MRSFRFVLPGPFVLTGERDHWSGKHPKVSSGRCHPDSGALFRGGPRSGGLSPFDLLTLEIFPVRRTRKDESESFNIEMQGTRSERKAEVPGSH